MAYLSDAAKYYKEEPHQKAAWEALEGKLDPKTLTEFKAAYRAKQRPLTKEIITPLVLSKLTGYQASKFSLAECDDFNLLLAETQFDQHLDPCRMLVANILHETGNLRHFKEIASGWDYEGRRDLGNTQSGDGPRFKGAGCLQLTGRSNYQRFADDVGDPRVMEGVEYVAKNYPYRSAQTWIKQNNLLAIARTGPFDAVCRRINGGYNGLQDRYKKYVLCRQYINF